MGAGAVHSPLVGWSQLYETEILTLAVSTVISSPSVAQVKHVSDTSTCTTGMCLILFAGYNLFISITVTVYTAALYAATSFAPLSC